MVSLGKWSTAAGPLPHLWCTRGQTYFGPEKGMQWFWFTSPQEWMATKHWHMARWNIVNISQHLPSHFEDVFGVKHGMETARGPPTLGLRDFPAIVQISPCNGEMELSVAMTDGWFQPTRVILLCKMIRDDISCISILTHTSIHAKSAQQRSAVLDSIRHGTHSHTHTNTNTLVICILTAWTCMRAIYV